MSDAEIEDLLDKGKEVATSISKDTKRLIEEKSAELRLSQNKLTELCLQRYLPEMRMWT